MTRPGEALLASGRRDTARWAATLSALAWLSAHALAQAPDAGAAAAVCGPRADCVADAFLGQYGGEPRVACGCVVVAGAAVTATGTSTAYANEHGDLELAISSAGGAASVSVNELRARTGQEVPVRVPERLRVSVVALAGTTDVVRASMIAEYDPRSRHEYLALVRVRADAPPIVLWAGDGDTLFQDCPDDALCGCAVRRTVTVRVRAGVAHVRSRITHDLSAVHDPTRRRCEPLERVSADVPVR